MTKTVIEKVAASSAGAAVFKVGGTLGYHENTTVEKFFQECGKRNISKLVLDFSSLKSLGGGCAKIIKKAVTEQGLLVAIAGASPTVARFIELQDPDKQLLLAETVEEALSKVGSSTEAVSLDGKLEGSPQESSPAGNAPSNSEPAITEESTSEVPKSPRAKEDEKPAGPAPGVIILGHDGSSASGGATQDEPVETDSAPSGDSGEERRKEEGGLRELKRKLIHYDALLGIGADFNRLDDRSALIEAFLLTTIAQIGVESASFYEEKEDRFVHFCSKGVEGLDEKLPSIGKDAAQFDEWPETVSGLRIEELPIDGDVKRVLVDYGIAYGILFIPHDRVRGIVFLGKSIKKNLDSDWKDFMRVLMTQAAISYEKAVRIEEESRRTLDLVNTLISLIEENTMGRGNTRAVVNYTYAVAAAMEYPRSHMKDLMLATALRDIGMIKVSDLIIRSPRDLLKEEWEVIKRHPTDGAEILKKMNFSQHAVEIVQCHHERFNGEGYPTGMEGQEIPLGARIVSVVESYVALVNDRPSRPALMPEEALNTLKENWGMRYDPEVVNIFLGVLEEELRSGKRVEFDHDRLFTG